ncbi:MAG: hypothetical protein K0S47_3042 [Herbinix sp.]|jgi:hypothetical protein|nr:hypothetical protein [Herbinix sp.]
MDKMDNNKATPTKRTGLQNDNNSDNNYQNNNTNTPEIEQPGPSTATPPIPAEMPAREVR